MYTYIYIYIHTCMYTYVEVRRLRRGVSFLCALCLLHYLPV